MEPFDGFPHVLQSQQFHPETLERIFLVADAIRSAPERFSNALAGRKVAVLFNQPSSRTRASFQLAAQNLGATVYAESNMALFSSEVKGETPEDTARMFVEYGFDYFVLRLKQPGAITRVAEVVGRDHPVINAGGGIDQHPTQALLDLNTIWRENHDLNRRIVILMVGDLENGRTVRSLTYLMAKYPGVEFVFLSPSSAQMRQDLLDHLNENGRQYAVRLDACIGRVVVEFNPDIVYMTRAQLETIDDPGKRAQLEGDYKNLILTPDVADQLKPEAIILHPLPRGPELPQEIDGNPRSRYFSQMGNGLWLRTALFERIEETMKRLLIRIHD
ncbi:MAG: aspartate carbamoyltransferase [Candidatus Kerfeldbacteria bacterium]